MTSGRISSRISTITRSFIKADKYWEGLLGQVTDELQPWCLRVVEPRQREILEDLIREARLALDRAVGPRQREWGKDKITCGLKALEAKHVYSAHLILVSVFCCQGRAIDPELADNTAGDLWVIYRLAKDAMSVYRQLSNDFPKLSARDRAVRLSGMLSRALVPAKIDEGPNRFILIRRLEVILASTELVAARLFGPLDENEEWDPFDE